MGWKVYLSESNTIRVESKVNELAKSLAGTKENGAGLMGGSAGLACFYAYFARWKGDLHFDRLVADMLGRAVNPSTGLFPGMMFSDGMGGIAWTIDHLYKGGLIKENGSEIFKKLDPHLFDAMVREIKKGHYDYLHGALGIALYYLRDPENEQYRYSLSVLVKELYKQAEQDEDSCMKWRAVLDGDKGYRGYNLSLSHGIASIIIILCRIMEAEIEAKLCEKMIKGGLAFLEKQRLDPEKYISGFPSWAIENEDDLTHSRLAWCYGDLGIGLAFIKAGILWPQKEYHATGLEILLNTCRRKDPEENNVRDAGICHGAAGVAFIYNSLYQKTENPAFMECAMYWLDICLNMAGHTNGIAGYRSWYHPKYGGWKNSTGLLDGAVGIGMVLLSFISNFEASWGQCLLLD